MSSRPAATLGTPAGYRRIGGRVNLLVHWRSLTVSGVAFVIILVGAVASLTTGTYPVSTTLVVDGQTYRFDARGYMVTGWHKDNGAWYYYSPSGAQASGWTLGSGTSRSACPP